MKYTKEEIREAVIAEITDYYKNYKTGKEEISEMVLRYLDAAFKRLPDEPNKMIPLAEVEQFIWEIGEDYHLWDEATQGQYPIKRTLTAIQKWFTGVSKRLPDRLPDDTKTMDDRLSTDVSGSVSFPKCKPKCCGREMYPCGGVLGKRPDGKVGDVEHLWRCDICKQETNDLLS